MKTRMKKLISIKIMPVLALALLIVLGSALAKGPARDPVSVSGTVDLITLSGPATATIRGEELVGSVTAAILVEPVPKDGGLYFPEVQHVFEFGEENSFTTTGEEFAMPKGKKSSVSTLHGNMEITGGTGVFEGASGELRINGQMDFVGGQAPFESHGVISGYGG